MHSCCRVIIIICTTTDAKWLLPSEHFDFYIPDWRGHIEAVCIEHVQLIPPPCSQYAQHNEMYKELHSLHPLSHA
jgi:hypothetical protein